MKQWIPLFDIFLNSATPEVEASIWLNQSFNASSSTPITTSSFISLLTQPVNALINSSSPPSPKRVIFIQTLPDMVQSRILSFLAVERRRFCERDLSRLVRTVLSNDSGIDLWVKKAARNLLDQMYESNYEWISGLSLDSGEDRIDDEEFESLPGWLKDRVSTDHELVFPWLPVSLDELGTGEFCGSLERERDSFSQVGEHTGGNLEEIVEEMDIDRPFSAPLAQEIQDGAGTLRSQVMNVESCSKILDLANEIRQLCLDKGGNSFVILGLIEPWKADDEIASVLLSHLLNETDNEELTWPSHVLSSIILPKLLTLEEPASRVLVAATIDYCKVHQRAAESALLFPLIMRNGGISNFICDVVTRIVKESLHPVHVSSFCRKLLCGEGERKFICLPCHQHLISNQLVWTESLFNLFHNMLNHNIQLTRDSVDQLALRVQELAQQFSKSLKFGNFLLCFITRCSLLLKSHKLLLTKAAEQTNTIATRSVLSKLASL